MITRRAGKNSAKHTGRFMENKINFLVAAACVAIALLGCGAENKGIELNKDILKYKTLSYGDFAKETGQEAQPYHATRFVAQIPGKEYEIVFLGEFDDDKLEAYITDDSPALRIQGKVKDFVTSDNAEIDIEAAKDPLGIVGSNYREGAGTIYYVSDYYVTLDIDTDGDNAADIFMDVAIDKDNRGIITSDAYAFLYWE